MRSVADDPEARATALIRAKTDSDFWLKCAEQGYGKAGQVLDIRTRDLSERDYRAAFDDGNALPATIAALPEGTTQ